MKKYNAVDVFTPTKPAKLTFVERQDIQDRLVDALRTSGKQIVVYGHSGSGKTTLLTNKLYQLYENHITTRCVLGMTFDQIILDAFDQLDLYYKNITATSSSRSISASISSEYHSIKTQIGVQNTNQLSQSFSRFLPPQLTPQRLAKFLGEAGCCWVLEDFHKIKSDEKTFLAQAMKVFMDIPSSAV